MHPLAQPLPYVTHAAAFAENSTPDPGKEIENESYYAYRTKGFHPDRIDDRYRDYRYFGGDSLPAYQDYTTRSKMSEVIIMTAPAKLAVAETASSLGGLTNVTATNNGYAFPGVTKYVSGVSISASGGIVTAVSTVPNATGNIVLTPSDVGSGQLSWVCTGTMLAKYLPSNCRP